MSLKYVGIYTRVQQSPQALYHSLAIKCRAPLTPTLMYIALLAQIQVNSRSIRQDKLYTALGVCVCV